MPDDNFFTAIGDLIDDLLEPIGVIILFAAFGFLAYDVFIWLRKGAWNPLTLNTLLKNNGIDTYSSYFVNDWVGINKVYNWFLERSMAMISGVAFVLVKLKLDLF